MIVEDGKKVTFDYTLTVEGQVLESSEPNQGLEYVHGEGKIIKGLERELAGMKVGDSKKVIVEPKDGYGEIDKDAYREVPQSQLPSEVKPEVGMMLTMKAPNGQQFPVMINEIKDDSIVLNFNHPLAGKELTFDVKVTDIN